MGGVDAGTSQHALDDTTGEVTGETPRRRRRVLTDEERAVLDQRDYDGFLFLRRGNVPQI